MAGNDRSSFNFDIPVGLIVLAWVFAWPVGLVLTILRVTSEKYKAEERNKAASASPYYAQKPAAKPAAAAKSTERKKYSTAELVLKICSFINFALGALIALGGVGEPFTAWLSETLPIALFFLASGGGLLWGSSLLKKRDVRLARIRTIIGKHESFNLSKLAAASDTSLRQVRRDLQRLIDSGEFGSQAYIDLGTNNFMRSPGVEADDPAKFDYKNVYGSLFKKKKKDGKAEEELDIKSDNDDFKTIIREIRRLNDEIEDAEVSDRICKIEGHTKNIFEYVSDHPEAMPQIRTFLNYYLPTTLKLLESYSRIEKVGVAGENMQKSKENIEATLDSLEGAFKRQIDELFKNESLDISSDISVLETMMSKDGLKDKKDFDLSGYSDEISDGIGGGSSAAAPHPEEK